MNNLAIATETPVSENKLQLIAIITKCNNEKFIEDITRALMLQQLIDEQSVKCSA